MSDNIPQLLTLAEIAERLRVSSHTVRSWVRQGRLKPVRICRRLLFSPVEISRFVTDAERRESEVSLRE
jgi:excisionase family DNA binding protein